MSIDLRADAERAGSLIPGAYERNTLTHREPGAMGAASVSVAASAGSNLMDASTTAEREREGGGAPNQRNHASDVEHRISSAGRGSWFTGGHLWSRVWRLAFR